MKYHVPENWRELCQNELRREVYALREEVNKLRGVIELSLDIWPASDWGMLKSVLSE